MSTVETLDALYDVRDEVAKEIKSRADTIRKVVAPYRDKVTLAWVKQVIDPKFVPEKDDPDSLKSAATRLYASRPFAEPKDWFTSLGNDVMAWLQKIESDIYRMETEKTAKVHQEQTPDWVEVKAKFEPKEEEMAMNAIIDGFPQEKWVFNDVRDLSESVQSRVAQTVLRIRGKFESSPKMVMDAIDSVFTTYEQGTRRMALWGGSWAANVARAAGNKSWAFKST